LANINPSSLVQGYGEQTCLFLNILADTAMKSKNHCWEQFVYPEEPMSHSPEQPLEAEIDDLVEEVCDFLLLGLTSYTLTGC
jgi:hypothetical protein